jgi:hypothetical protein
MTEPTADGGPAYPGDEDNSLLVLGSVLLRWRRTIVALGLSGAVVGLAWGLLSTRVYMSWATFIPQGAEQNMSALAQAASQFGVQLPAGAGDVWGPPVYVELLQSRAMLEPIALDSVVVAEQAGRRVALMDLLDVEAPTPAWRVQRTIVALRKMIRPSELKRIGAVRVTVTTRWPSVSLALAQRLVRDVNRFNFETRKSQAAAERQFAEVQAREAERSLREAEDQLQLFLQRNRDFANSPVLAFQRDRLQRDVALQQQMYVKLLQNREDAKLREVRDTPVITVLEDPRLAAVRESRRSLLKALLGGVVGAMLGAFIAALRHWAAAARRRPSPEAQEFFRLAEEVRREVRKGVVAASRLIRRGRR